MKNVMKTGLLLLTIALIAGAACVRVGEMKEKTVVTPLENADSAELDLRIGAGELKIQPGATDALMSGYFKYNVKRWEPEITYRKSGSKGYLRIEQHKSSGITLGNTRNLWDLQVNNKIPLDLQLNLGAGEANLDLNGLQVKSLEIHMGVGSLSLDLSADRTANLEGSIHGGVGSGTILLPKTTGVRVRVDGGIGSVNTSGFSKSGDTYTNEAYGKTPASIELNIKAGIGSIELRTK
jgi:N-terminal domain of toast_rack, DUF2154